MPPTKLIELNELTAKQRRALGYLKALELTNAALHLSYEADDELKNTIGGLVRQTIRDRRLTIRSMLIVCLNDPQVRAIADYGGKLFHLGKKDPAVWEEAKQLSNQLCDALYPEICLGLEMLHIMLPGYEASLVAHIKEKYLPATTQQRRLNEENVSFDDVPF